MYTQEDVRKVQMRLLDIAKAIKEILERHDIPYFITYGTLLGAVRHKGFIPWDDDFDFYLFDDTYAKAVECLKKELPADYFLENEESEPLYFHGWAHVKDIHSETKCELFPQDSSYAHKGISVDLYRTICMNESNYERYRAEEHLAYIERRRKHGLITEEDYRQRQEKQLAALELIKDKKPDETAKNIYSEISIYKNKGLYPDELFPLKQYQFEDTSFLGPNKPEAQLTRCYGDYMQLPPVDKRKPHYSEVIFFNKENK